MTNLCEEYDKFLSENDERFKELSGEKQFYINAIGYGVKYYDLYRRIEKAIEYIEKHKYPCLMEHYSSDVDNLLDILKGCDNE